MGDFIVKCGEMKVMSYGDYSREGVGLKWERRGGEPSGRGISPARKCLGPGNRAWPELPLVM